MTTNKVLCNKHKGGQQIGRKKSNYCYNKGTKCTKTKLRAKKRVSRGFFFFLQLNHECASVGEHGDKSPLQRPCHLGSGSSGSTGAIFACHPLCNVPCGFIAPKKDFAFKGCKMDESNRSSTNVCTAIYTAH